MKELHSLCCIRKDVSAFINSYNVPSLVGVPSLLSEDLCYRLSVHILTKLTCPDQLNDLFGEGLDPDEDFIVAVRRSCHEGPSQGHDGLSVVDEWFRRNYF